MAHHSIEHLLKQGSLEKEGNGNEKVIALEETQLHHSFGEQKPARDRENQETLNLGVTQLIMPSVRVFIWELLIKICNKL